MPLIKKLRQAYAKHLRHDALSKSPAHPRRRPVDLAFEARRRLKCLPADVRSIILAMAPPLPRRDMDNGDLERRLTTHVCTSCGGRFRQRVACDTQIGSGVHAGCGCTSTSGLQTDRSGTGHAPDCQRFAEFCLWHQPSSNDYWY